MKPYSLFIFIICCIDRHASIEIKLELKKIILKFGYSTNYKCEGLLAHSLDRFYLVTKFILPTIEYLKCSTLNFNGDGDYIRKKEKGHHSETEQHILDLITYCRKIKPYVDYYKQQIIFLMTPQHILKNEIDLILPQFPTRKEKTGIISALASGFIGLAYKGISSFLHDRRHIALHNAVKAMDKLLLIQHNKFMHLEDSMVMHGIYNNETLEKLIDNVYLKHNITTPKEKLFGSLLSTAHVWYCNIQGIQHYAINSLLYLRTIKEKYIKMYIEFRTELHIYAKAIRILAKGTCPFLITPLKVKEILHSVKMIVRKMNPDYDIVINRIHLYYYMKLVTFGIDRDKNLIIQFQVIIQSYTQLLVLYQIETVPFPINDQNKQADSFTHLQLDRP